MINGKPQLTFGGSSAVPVKAKAQSAKGAGGKKSEDFASYLAPVQKGQRSAATTQNSAAYQGEMPKAKMHLGFLPEGYISPNLQPSAYAGENAAGRGTGRNLGDARQLSGQQMRSYGQRDMAAGQHVSTKRAPRISGLPITGRGQIGMVDTRKTAGGRSTLTTRGASAHAAPTANAAHGLGLGMSPQALGQGGKAHGGSGHDAFSGYGLDTLRGMPTSFVAGGFSGRTAETALTSLGYNLQEIRTVQTKARLLGREETTRATFARGQEGAQLAVKTAEHKRAGLPLPQGAYPPGSLARDFYSMANQGLGTLAAKFESGSEGIAAIGYDYKGGTSYGKYQISSRAGTMAKFIDYLEGEAPDLASRLRKAGPANTGGRSGRMPKEWRNIAMENPERFEKLQSDFILSSHFQPAMQGIAEMTGVAFNIMPLALQEVLFSTAVQHGPSGAVRIFSQALNSVGPNRLRNNGDSPSPSFLQAGRQLIEKVYSLRAGQFVSSTSRVRAAVKNRLSQEMREALQML